MTFTIATTPGRENTLPRDSVPAMIAAEARADWIGPHPEDNRLQLEAVTEYDAPREVRRAGAKPRPPTLLVFVPEDHVNTPGSFREYARITGADTVAFTSSCGHMAPVCDTEAIGAHVRKYLDAESEGPRASEDGEVAGCNDCHSGPRVRRVTVGC